MNEVFIQRLKELRTEARLSQREIAKLLEIRQQSYAQYENGKSEPSLETLARLAKIFHVSADYLIGLTDY